MRAISERSLSDTVIVKLSPTRFAASFLYRRAAGESGRSRTTGFLMATASWTAGSSGISATTGAPMTFSISCLVISNVRPVTRLTTTPRTVKRLLRARPMTFDDVVTDGTSGVVTMRISVAARVTIVLSWVKSGAESMSTTSNR